MGQFIKSPDGGMPSAQYWNIIAGLQITWAMLAYKDIRGTPYCIINPLAVQQIWKRILRLPYLHQTLPKALSGRHVYVRHLIILSVQD